MMKSFQLSTFSFQLILVILSALLLTLSFPDFNFEFLAWVALVPLFFAMDSKGPRQSFRIAYITGLLFFLGTIYWLIHVTLLGTIALILYLALYFGFFGLVFSSALKSSRVVSLFLIPSIWVTLEWIRSNFLSGFGWNLLGHSQAFTLPVIQIADIFGAYGVTFLIVMVNTAIYLTIKGLRNKEDMEIPIFLTIILVFLSLAYGNFRLNNIFAGEELSIGVVQGNIPQAEKWDESFREGISRRYEDLTRELAKGKIDLIVWPETSVPGFLESEPDLLERTRNLVLDINTPLLVGTIREDAKYKDVYYNSATLFLKDGSIAATYDKTHLVPFGEYIPLKKVFSFVEKIAPAPIGDVNKGKDYTVFSIFIERRSEDAGVRLKKIKKVKFATLICFEDIFPAISREFIKKGAMFLVNITNDAWYKKTGAAYQHAQCSVFRAVENRTNVIRATNTGLSCFIDQKGRITAKVDKNGESLFVDGFESKRIALTRTRTIYNLYGDVFAYMCILFTMLCLLRQLKAR